MGKKQGRRPGAGRARPAHLTRRAVLAAALGAPMLAARRVGAEGPAPAATGGFETLRRRVAGDLLVRGDPLYDAARVATWAGGTPARFPAAILRARRAGDAIEAVRFARAAGLKIAVRGGGHNWVFPSLRDGSLMIDVSALRAATVNPALKRARVGPGLGGGEFLGMLAPHGLAFPVAHCPSVPLSGYLLNGGWGINAAVWGPASSNIRAMEIVTAEGRLMRASPRENPDLFWAARGAGPGFFGVVTAFELDLKPLPRALATTSYVLPIDRAPEAAAWADGRYAELPRNVEFFVLASGQPGIRRAGDPRFCTIAATALADDPDAAARALDFAAGPPFADAALAAERARPTTLYGMIEGATDFFPPGKRYLGNNLWSDAPLGQVFADFAAVLPAAPSPDSLGFSIFHHPPHPGETPGPGPTPSQGQALSMEKRAITMYYAVWTDPADDAANATWFANTTARLDRYADGHYIGEVDLALGPEKAARSYAPAAWARLSELKRRYDPDDIFHGFWGAS